MVKPLEIRWHGRGGQGAKTAAFLLAEAMIEQGKYAQGFPDYGPERMGAPIRGYNRISSEPIRLHCDIENPEIVIVLDPTLLSSEKVTAGLASDGKLIINSSEDPEDFRSKIDFGDATVYTVDATKIALEEIGRPIPNLPMIGALLKVSDLADIEEMTHVVSKKFESKFSKQVVEGNLRAMRRAYEEVRG